MPHDAKPASAATARVNKEAASRYAMDDRQDFTDADLGFLAPFPDKLYGSDGRVIFDAGRFHSSPTRYRHPTP